MDGTTVGYMKQHSAFSEFSDDELDILSTVFRVRRLAQDETLCKQGDAYASLLLVVEGQLKSHRELPGGNVLELGTFGADSVLGAKYIIDGARRWETVEVVADTQALECYRDDFLRMFRANSVLAYKVLDFVITDMSNGLRQFDRAIEHLMSS